MIGAVNSNFAFGATYQVRGKYYYETLSNLKEVAEKTKKTITSFEETNYNKGAGQHFNIKVNDTDGSFWNVLKEKFGNDAFIVSKK